VKSKSKAAFKKNVSEMVKSGHPVKQAVAAAYSVKRKSQGESAMKKKPMKKMDEKKMPKMPKKKDKK